MLPAIAITALGQEFDAVSVKPSDPNRSGGTVVNLTPGAGLRVSNATLKDMIETAYDVRSFQIVGGPSWVAQTRYDVTATAGPKQAAPASSEVRLRAQGMLKDRFQLQLHRETRNESIYSLVVANGGIKPGFALTDSPHRGVNAGKGTMIGEAASMADLISKLSRLLDRPIVNNTGLEGKYDCELEWTPDVGPPSDGQPAEGGLGPSLFSAVQQQLGLRLEATKGPVEILVIDHVERPSEN